MASRKITTPTADGYVQFNDSVVVNSSFLSHSISECCMPCTNIFIKYIT